jgi:anti-sigma factor RsiW
MSSESHDRARRLLRAAQVEGISAGDRQWLDAHLAGCSECSNEATAMVAAIDSLRALRVMAPEDMVRRTALAVHQRAQQRRPEREPTVFLWTAAGIASIFAIATIPYTLAAFAWIGRILDLPDTVWQLGFLMWWFFPATVLGAVAAWRHSLKPYAPNWAHEEKWGQS